MKILQIFFALFFLFFQTTLFAGEADVIKVDVIKNSENTYGFNVTVFHEDTGWNHYADKWEVIMENGTILGVRILQHPHENEQPFTRSLSGIEIPDHIESVIIRGHDSIHKYGGKVITVKLPPAVQK